MAWRWTETNRAAIVRPLLMVALYSADRGRGRAEHRRKKSTQMTIGTRLYTWVFGKYVGADGFGNRYYRTKRQPRWGREQRWVIYKGSAEASKVPPEWHAWLHHMTVEPLTEQAARARAWQTPHVPNLTGTPYAYRPKGHELRGGARAPATGDYEAWTPE